MNPLGSLAVFAILVLTTLGCGSSGHLSETGSAIRYGQIAGIGHRPELDVWQLGSNGEVILQWHGDTEATSFDPSKRRVIIIDGGSISSIDDYGTADYAWAQGVNPVYGVSRAEVASALSAGRTNLCALRVARVREPTLIEAHFPVCRGARTG